MLGLPILLIALLSKFKKENLIIYTTLQLFEK